MVDKTSDVYVAARMARGLLKASIHESGLCHVRAPDPQAWQSPGAPPAFLDKWKIDPAAAAVLVFHILIPTSELREGPWAVQRKRDTTWVTPRSEATDIGVFLTRVKPEPRAQLAAAGWSTTIAADTLPDSRQLWLMAGDTAMAARKRVELDNFKISARNRIPPTAGNYRAVLFAGAEGDVRTFVEVGF
jgi:hypothetical protein